MFQRGLRASVFASFDTWRGTIRVLCHRKLGQCYRIISITIRLPIILFTRGGKHGYSCIARIIRIKCHVAFKIARVKIYFISVVAILFFSIVGNIFPLYSTNLCFEKLYIYTWMNRRDSRCLIEFNSVLLLMRISIYEDRLIDINISIAYHCIIDVFRRQPKFLPLISIT